MVRRGKTPVRAIRVDDATWRAAQRTADDRNEDLPDVIRAFLKRYARTAPGRYWHQGREYDAVTVDGKTTYVQKPTVTEEPRP